MRSEGVTMAVEATMPVSMPAAMDCAVVDRCVSGSSKRDRMLSKATKRTASLPMEPYMLDE